MSNNSDKIVIISGGLGDIGSAIAILFGRQGFRVALSDLVEEQKARIPLENLRSRGCKELFYQKVDVASENAVINWLEAVEKKWGMPQIIVPNAGIVVTGAITSDDLPTEQIRHQIEVNFWGSFYLSVLAAKKLKISKLPGRIIFIGSWAAERANARISSYCISKAALRMLCKTMALELAENNILVNEIAPGIVAGGLSKKNQDKDPKLLKTHLNSIPTQKLVSLDEIAKQVLQLADFENFSMTGTTILMDGGLSLTSKMT